MWDRGKESVRADIKRPQIPAVCSEIAVIFAKGFKIKAAGERFPGANMFFKLSYTHAPNPFPAKDWGFIGDICQNTHVTVMKYLPTVCKQLLFCLNLYALCCFIFFSSSLRCVKFSCYVCLDLEQSFRFPKPYVCLLATTCGCDISPNVVLFETRCCMVDSIF